MFVILVWSLVYLFIQALGWHHWIISVMFILSGYAVIRYISALSAGRIWTWAYRVVPEVHEASNVVFASDVPFRNFWTGNVLVTAGRFQTTFSGYPLAAPLISHSGSLQITSGIDSSSVVIGPYWTTATISAGYLSASTLMTGQGSSSMTVQEDHYTAAVSKYDNLVQEFVEAA